MPTPRQDDPGEELEAIKKTQKSFLMGKKPERPRGGERVQGLIPFPQGARP
jgi:hypothetical protein